jgi:hypothetical protein
MTTKSKEALEYNFLVDEPVKDNQLLQFGHFELGKTLVNIVRKCETPFTLGLFGKWGSGKSTLAYFLEDNLPDYKIPVVIFDIWKHEKDNVLRRAFIKELVVQLKEKYGKQGIGKDIFKEGDDEFKVNDRIDSSVTKDNEGKFKVNWKKIKQVWKFLLALIAIGLLIPAVPATIFKSWNIFWNILSWITSLIFGGVFLAVLLKFTTTFFYTETTTFGLDRFQDPSEFEKEFKRILESIKDDYGKILIIFDNIDRVSSDKAIEILSAIKTFLEPDKNVVKKKVVFLVPCDAQALREHIRVVYKVEDNSSYDPDEFLRKFFNTTIRIPDFFVTEMEKYVKDKLIDTKINHFKDDRISALITIAFRDNPRQVIQFINVFLANYLLILQRCGKNKDFDSDFLDKKTPELCRFLLLESRFPPIIEKIKAKNIYDIDSIDIKELKSLGINDENILEEFVDIRNQTMSLAPLKNVRIFYTMRRSVEEKEFSGINDFYRDLEGEKSEKAQSFIKGINNFQKRKQSLSRLIKDYLNKISNPIIKARFIDTLLLVLYNEKKDLENTYYPIYTAIKNLTFTHLIYIQPKVFTEVVLKHREEWRKVVFNKWIAIMGQKKDEDEEETISEDFIEELLSVFISHLDRLTQSQIAKLKKNIVQPAFFISTLGKLLTANKKIQDKILTKDYLKGFVENMVTDDITQEIPENIEIAARFEDKLFTEEINKEMLRKLTEILKKAKEEAKASDILENETEFLNNNIYVSLNKLIVDKRDNFSKIDDHSLWNDMLNTINQLYSSTKNNHRRVFMPLFFSLWVVAPKNTKNQLQMNITNFIQQASIEDIKYFMPNSGDLFLTEGEVFMQVLENKAVQKPDYFLYLYDDFFKENIDLKYNILVKFINTNLTDALSKIKAEHLNIPNKARIVKRILDKFDSASDQDKVTIIKICNLTKCAKEESLKNQLAEEIKALLTQPDKKQQIIAYGVDQELNYLGDEKLRRMTKEIFDWIKQQGLASKYHIVPITFVYDLNRLENEEKKELSYYLFQILKNSNNLDELQLASKVLLKIKPKRKDRQQAITDLEDRTNKEGNSTIKQVLQKVLKKL